MSMVQQTIEVSAPLHRVYEQVAAFESYPRFMTGVERVVQTSNTETHWIMDLGGQRCEFDAQITECSPDKRVAWAAMDGPRFAETITLRPVGEARTQVVAQLEADIAALLPSDRHAQESLHRRLKDDLVGLKKLVERSPDTLLSGIGTIAAGAGSEVKASPPSPATLAARMSRKHATADRCAAPAAGTQSGGAGMGAQRMTRDDAWGDGMINEEERGSAYDM